MKSKLAVSYGVIIAAICIASVFILHHTKRQHAQNTIQKDTISSFIHNAAITEYNANGQIKTKITAETVTQYQETGSTLFKKPIIITYTADHTAIHIHADQATTNKSNDKIILQGHVIVHKLQTAKHAESTLKTTELTVYPKESRAETDKSVTLSRPGTVIDGKGFRANLKTGQYQVHSESRIIYQIQNSDAKNKGK